MVNTAICLYIVTSRMLIDAAQVPQVPCNPHACVALQETLQMVQNTFADLRAKAERVRDQLPARFKSKLNPEAIDLKFLMLWSSDNASDVASAFPRLARELKEHLWAEHLAEHGPKVFDGGKLVDMVRSWTTYLAICVSVNRRIVLGPIHDVLLTRPAHCTWM